MNQNSNLPPVFKKFEQTEKKKIERHNELKIIAGCIHILAGACVLIHSVFAGICLLLCGLLLFPPILSWIEKELKVSSKSLKYLYIGLLFSSAIASAFDHNGVYSPPVKKVAIRDTTKKAADSPNYQSKILKQETITGGHTNFWVLVNTNDLSEPNVKRIAFELRDKLCSGECTIALYDSQDAFKMDEKLENKELELGRLLTDGKISKEQNKARYEKYEKKYYVQIADHLIGTLLMSETFNYYPYRDSRYKALTGEPTIKVNPDPGTVDSVTTTMPGNNNVQLSESEQRDKVREGEFNLESYVRGNMNDPDSYERISFDYSYEGTYFIIVLKFRGKNAFGGKVINYIKAKADLKGNIIKIYQE